jgi:hypothetical protein
MIPYTLWEEESSYLPVRITPRKEILKALSVPWLSSLEN